MKNRQRVVWSKGMFLTPQHFQAQDGFVEDNLQFRFAAALFANWGVTRLEIDPEALANGTFTLQSCRGVMPDGLAFSFPDSDASPGARPFVEYFGPTQESMDVYLAIPEHLPQGLNFSLAAAGEGSAGVAARYTVEALDTNDESAPSEQKTIQVARKNFRLLFEGQNMEGFSILRIARVGRKDAAYSFDPEFIAPCIDISSSEQIMMVLRRLIEILATKSDALNTSRRQRSKDLADYSVSEAANFWFLHTVNSCLPELKHIWAVRRGHPELLYVTLLRLAGALSTFVIDSKVRDLPDYDHDNLGTCFGLLDEEIRRLLEIVIKSKCISIPLRQDKTIWSGSISNDEYLQHGSQFFLAVSAKMGIDDVIKRVPQLVKVTATDEMQNLIRLALPGLTLRHSPSPPSSILFKLENQYFGINQSGPLWERITHSRNISVHVPSEVVGAKVELLVVLQ